MASETHGPVAPPPSAEHSQLGHLSAFDAFMLVTAVLGACALALLRNRRRLKNGLEIWISDALNIGTLVVLLAVIMEMFLPHIAWLENIARTNEFLVALALVYCVAVIANSLRKSVAVAVAKGGGRREARRERLG